MKRRELVAGLVGGAVAPTLDPEPWQRLSHALDRSSLTDAKAVGALERMTADFFAREELEPARTLLPALHAHLSVSSELLHRVARHDLWCRLAISAGEAAALAGWMAWDLGRHDSASAHYAVAIRAARETGHGPLLSLVLAYRSYATAALGDPREARAMLVAAQQHVRGEGSATARAWLAAREAEEAATAGNREAAVRAMERAMTAYDYAHPGREPAWVQFLSRPRLDSMCVSTYGRLAHPQLDSAVDSLLGGLDARDCKTRAVILADIARAYVGTGAPDQGIAVARQALIVTLEGEVSLGRQRLQEVCDLLEPYSGEHAKLARELRAALTA